MPNSRSRDRDISGLYLENCLPNPQNEIKSALNNYSELERLQDLYARRKQELDFLNQQQLQEIKGIMKRKRES